MSAQPKDTGNSVVKLPTASQPLTPSEMLGRAVESGASIDVLEKLMSLQERWEANQARKAFDEAMSSAKSEMPVILKNREVNFGGGRASYKFEDLAGIARTIDPVLTKHGLSYRYRTASEPGMTMVTCIVSHRGGHSEENSLTAAPDNSGSKNGIQAVGSTITYLQRYTLKAALGLSASADDDGNSFGASDKITDVQLDALIELSDAVDADKVRFCKYMKIESLSALPASRFAEAMAALEAKRK